MSSTFFTRRQTLASIGSAYLLANFDSTLRGNEMAEKLRYSLTSRLTFKDRSPQLELVLENISNDDLTIRNSELPWSVCAEMNIFVTSVGGNPEILVPDLLLVDPGFGNHVIKPKKKIIGTIDIASRIPRIMKLAAKFDLAIFWTYFLKDVNDKGLGRTGGWLDYPKSS